MHLDADDEGIHARPAVGAALLAQRQQGRHQHGADMGVADLQHVVIVQRMGRRAVDQRRPGRRQPMRRTGDHGAPRTARAPARDAAKGRAGRGIVRARQHAGGGVHEGAARPPLRVPAPRARRLGDPTAEPPGGTGRGLRLRETRHRLLRLPSDAPMVHRGTAAAIGRKMHCPPDRPKPKTWSPHRGSLLAVVQFHTMVNRST